uniref:Mediator of RNA polymerase II transcription subunit 26 n=1 Tax=Dermatophagoides pteronyssinus TaxID=6956 RepID=A0A6P6XZ33_DERPT|nr:putative mediator of RNA polymerase II transcription subunit 26 [Dermatophagoides pteronyssinus]
MSNQCFMPSDIARLTYGYLLETNCQRTAQCFLDESPYLREFAQGIKNGFRYSTKPYNMSLTETLNGKFSQNINQMQSTVSATTTTFPNNFPPLHYQTTNVKNTNLPLESHNNNNINREHLSTPKHKILQSRNLNAYSPRRKNATPKRLSLMTNPHQQQQQLYQSDSSSTMNCLTSDSNVQQMLSLANTNSSPISSLACESSEIDIEVQPRIIFDELLKYRPLHDKVANTIQKIIDVKDQPMLDDNITNIINQQQQQEQQNIKNSQHCLTTDHAIDSNKIGDIEKDLLPPDTMDELLSSLAEEPEFQNFVHIVVEKEIANTPFKCQSSTFNTPSNTSNSSSLNTPNVFMTPINTNHNNQQSNVDKIHQKNSSMVPVKNLINELKTPERLSLTNNRLNVTNNNKSNLITTTTTSSNNLVATGSICSSSSTKIKPILQNHKFSRVNNKQREVQESIKNTTLNNNKIATATTNKPTALTTTIELVSDDHGGNHDAPVKSSFINNNDNGNGPNEQKSTTTTTSTSNSQMVCPQINNNNVEIVSIQNWSSTPTPTTNVLTRPVLLQDNNNQTITAWSDQQGLVYLTYPTTTIAAAATTATQETIYYLDSSNLQLSSTSTTINDSSLNATKITTAANDSIITDNDKSSVQEINSVSQQSNRSTVGSPRTVPSILSRGKRQPKIAIQDSKINQDCSNQPSAISSDYHHQSPSINRRKSDIKNSSGHHNSTQHNNQQQKKRKISGHFNGDSSNHHHHQTTINKRSPVMDTKVEKILGSNIEEFLVNYHGK